MINFDKFDVEKQKKLIKFIYQSGQNTYKLLENLLLWSRSQSGVIDFNPKIENLYLLSKETVDLLSHAVNAKTLKLTNKISENIKVKVDKEMFVTILRNILTNAIKFTPRGGSISINAHSITNDNNQSFTEISINDNGIGIPPEILNKLFSITENISVKGTENEEGTGLGLILCKEFVEKHGGKIKVESKENIGSTFSFTIPNN